VLEQKYQSYGMLDILLNWLPSLVCYPYGLYWEVCTTICDSWITHAAAARWELNWLLLQTHALSSWNYFSHASGSNDCHSSAGRWPDCCPSLFHAGNLINSSLQDCSNNIRIVGMVRSANFRVVKVSTRCCVDDIALNNLEVHYHILISQVVLKSLLLK
jgi:hypothetical protein